MVAFEAQMEDQRNRARSASRFSATDAGGAITTDAQTEFTGYEQTQGDAQIVSLFENAESADQLSEGASGAVLLDTTTFYAESGGQIGDSGILSGAGFEFTVADTQKQGNAFLHIGQVSKGTIQSGVSVSTQVDSARRGAIVLNHSATHLMHAALRQVLGEHVQQKGSLVTEQRLRFDFSHFEPMTPEQTLEIETIVNTEIRNNASASAKVMAMDKAIETGAMALFGEKYGDDVRVVNIGFSTELCGGVHVERAGDIGLFKIVAESGIASGVRRIEAVTGDGALSWIGAQQQQLSQLAGLLKTDTGSVATRLTQMIEHQRNLEKELDQLKSGMAAQAGESLVDQAVEIDGIKVLAAKIDGADSKALRDTVDKLKDKLGQAAIVVASENAGKISLIAGVTKAETKRIRAGDLVNFVATQVGGKGGGRPDMAQAGGSDVAKLAEALASVNDWVASQLNT
jgi:alanyl-tRNA synthetase